MCVWDRLNKDNHLTNQKRNKTQIERKIILFVELKLMEEIFQRIVSSQSRIADFFIKFKEFAEKENRYQSHRCNQNLDVKLKPEGYLKKPDKNQNKR